MIFSLIIIALVSIISVILPLSIWVASVLGIYNYMTAKNENAGYKADKNTPRYVRTEDIKRYNKSYKRKHPIETFNRFIKREMYWHKLNHK